MLLTETKFVVLTGVVIDNFEGGYFHPNMKARMSDRDQQIIGDSGETMYGLDRKHGATELAHYAGWTEFWNLLDVAGAATKWKHYYIPSEPLKTQLKTLCARIMYGWYGKLQAKYINSAGEAIIAADDRLIIHFSYASWNGEGWFKNFAQALNVAVATYPHDREKIYQETIKARTLSGNEVMRRQGANMLKVFAKLNLK